MYLTRWFRPWCSSCHLTSHCLPMHTICARQSPRYPPHCRPGVLRSLASCDAASILHFCPWRAARAAATSGAVHSGGDGDDEEDDVQISLMDGSVPRPL